MKGKSYSIPAGMVFKKYYCSHCGAKLVKSKTHRVVSKDDKDYYQYRDYGTFPRCDYDVYDYEFKCEKCNKKISYDEQCIIERIQKKLKKKVLSEREIKNNYNIDKIKHSKWILVRNIIIPIVFITIFMLLYFIFKTDKSKEEVLFCLIIYLLSSGITIFMAIRSYYGKHRLRMHQTYSNEERLKFEKLHAYASNNKELIKESEYCYCFHCKKQFESKEVVRYLEGENTALCPHCGIDAIIPNNVDEPIDNELIEGMNKYWF